MNQLSSKSTHEQLDAMRWLVTETSTKKSGSYMNMSKHISFPAGEGNSASEDGNGTAENFLPSVVKLLATKHPELKRLVYIFLVRHAESKPDDTLMAVNEIQKGLNDSNNAQARVLSVRVLSSIRVQDIVPITFVVVKNSVFDPNSVVRKAAVIGLAKLYSFNREMKRDLFDILIKVLDSEPSPSVLGTACEVFNSLCPEELEAIHWSYRKICKLLVDMDEWSQVAALNLLHRYARNNFVNPNKASHGAEGGDAAFAKSTDQGAARANVDDFYGDEGTEEEGGSDAHVTSRKRPEDLVTDDHKLLLRCSWPLLQSRNSACVMAVAALQFDFAPSYEHHRCAKALMFCMRSTRSASEYVILHSVASFAYKYPDVFAPHFTGFFVRASDPLHVKCLKLNILTQIIQEDQIPGLLKELQAYLRDNEMTFVSDAIFALGRCVQKYPRIQERILKSLMVLSTHSSEEVSANSVQVILGIAQDQPDLYMEQIANLIKRYGLLASPKAKMGVLWLSSCHLTLHSRQEKTEEETRAGMKDGDFDKLSALAYEAARLGTLNFIKEEEEVKMQILNTLAKLSIHGMDEAGPLFDYVMAMAMCDASYNIRDRARLFAGLTSGDGAPSEEASLGKKIVLASGHLTPISSHIGKGQNSFSIGSLSHLVDHCAPGYQTMPDFRDVPTNSTLRDPRIFQSAASAKQQQLQQHNVSNGNQYSAGVAAAPRAVGGAGAISGSPLDTFYSDSEESYSYSYSEEEEEEEELPLGQESKGEET